MKNTVIFLVGLVLIICSASYQSEKVRKIKIDRGDERIETDVLIDSIRIDKGEEGSMIGISQDTVYIPHGNYKMSKKVDYGKDQISVIANFYRGIAIGKFKFTSQKLGTYEGQFLKGNFDKYIRKNERSVVKALEEYLPKDVFSYYHGEIDFYLDGENGKQKFVIGTIGIPDGEHKVTKDGQLIRKFTFSKGVPVGKWTNVIDNKTTYKVFENGKLISSSAPVKK